MPARVELPKCSYLYANIKNSTKKCQLSYIFEAFFEAVQFSNFLKPDVCLASIGGRFIELCEKLAMINKMREIILEVASNETNADTYNIGKSTSLEIPGRGGVDGSNPACGVVEGPCRLSPLSDILELEEHDK